jgi:hypothetical protein
MSAPPCCEGLPSCCALAVFVDRAPSPRPLAGTSSLTLSRCCNVIVLYAAVRVSLVTFSQNLQQCSFVLYGCGSSTVTDASRTTDTSDGFGYTSTFVYFVLLLLGLSLFRPVPLRLLCRSIGRNTGCTCCVNAAHRAYVVRYTKGNT